ncbi:hypothetical protein SISNIDRAFT_448436 [Sistotremastrum niveocremeum HHB9708]|uniref:Uncharacterized protein n=1 Tax=Sistotremastrum niveocremeum HHB9708 TaxID=1314777 RepID=A0A164ZYT7_9AGAM|nr:hypothetical protein SISNIDRAFT_448436 [Sistotremastrum niveocremeum HHB9708]
MKSKHTEEQLAWLRSHLPEYENRATAAVRGDAKGFALKCAEEYIAKWGLGTGPDEEKESQVKERIYTWFKNTSARGKEARRKHAQFKSERDVPTNVGAYTGMFDPSDDSKKTESPTFPSNPNPHASLKPIVPRDPPTLATTNLALVPSPLTSRVQESPLYSAAGNGTTPYPLLTDAFLAPSLPPSSLAAQITNAAGSAPYYACMAPAISALFSAAASIHSQLQNMNAPQDPMIELLRRFKLALPHLSPTINHYGTAGPQAGVRALRVQLRKNATWISSPSYNYPSASSYSPSLPNASSHSPNSAVTHSHSMPPPPTSPSANTPTATPRRGEAPFTIQDQMYRTAIDRQRKKEHLVWAAIHGAALEVGLIGSAAGQASLLNSQPPMSGLDPNPTISQQTQIQTNMVEHHVVEPDDGSSKLAEAVARDAIWEQEEVEWVAGAYLLRAVTRTKRRSGAPNLNEEWEPVLQTYEGRWKEIRDDVREQIMENLLIGIKQALDQNSSI